MEDNGKIEIHVEGKIGNVPLSPDNFDIREIRRVFDVVESLLVSNKRINRAPIGYSIENGSVRNVFTTSAQLATAFLAVVSMTQQSGNLDGLELPMARALQEIQESAVRNNYTYGFGKPNAIPMLTISPSTQYRINSDLWVDAEFYFYGVLVNAGGKGKSNIHLETKENGLLIIDTKREFLQGQEKNVLYKHFSVRAKGKQNIHSGETDFSSLVLLDLVPHDNRYDALYLENLMQRATKSWEDVPDADAWLAEIRSSYE